MPNRSGCELRWAQLFVGRLDTIQTGAPAQVCRSRLAFQRVNPARGASRGPELRGVALRGVTGSRLRGLRLGTVSEQYGFVLRLGPKRSILCRTSARSAGRLSALDSSQAARHRHLAGLPKRREQDLCSNSVQGPAARCADSPIMVVAPDARRPGIEKAIRVRAAG